MKVSVAWLRELSGVDLPVDRLAHVLTMGGLEVEEVAPVAGAFEKIVVAHVLGVAPHPNADKLRVTEVDAGTGMTLTIVCGAPNVAAGQKVPCALVGAKLPGLEIKQAKLRGVESSGMLCSARELGLSDDHAGLLVLPAGRARRRGHPRGPGPRRHDPHAQAHAQSRRLPVDVRHRARHRGAHRQAAHPPRAPAASPTIADTREVRISDRAACGPYFGRVIRGIDAAAKTPAWMVRRLERAGLRPRSPLVDITNYVMLERGQPHARLRPREAPGRHRRAHGEARRGAEAPERAMGRVPPEPAPHHRRVRPRGAGRRDGRVRQHGDGRDDGRLLRGGVLRARGDPGPREGPAARERRGLPLRARRRLRRHARGARARHRAHARDLRRRGRAGDRGARRAPGAQARARAPGARARAAGLRRGRCLHGRGAAAPALHGRPRRRGPRRDAPQLALRPRHRGGLRRGGRARPRLRARAGGPAALERADASRRGRRAHALRPEARGRGAGLPGSHQLQLRLVAVGGRFRGQRRPRCGWPIPSRARWT